MASELQFCLKQWCAWLPPEWRLCSYHDWGLGRLLPGAEPDVSFLPLMQRRRLSPMARAVLAVAWPCLKGAGAIPTVCASLHGETHYCFPILNTLAEGADVSPTAFTLSVHGAAGALLSQFAGNRAPFVALAPGAEGYSAAVVEARGFLQAQAHEVLLLLYEQPLPLLYHTHAANPLGVMALAMKLGVAKDKGSLLQVKRDDKGEAGNEEDTLLKLIWALCQGNGAVNLPGRKSAWRWVLTG